MIRTLPRRTLRLAVCSALFLACASFTSLAAQEPGTQPETSAPPVPPPLSGAQAAPGAAPLAGPSPAAYTPRLDWPWLDRFRDEDAALGPPAAGEQRVVFMGDSITVAWKFTGPQGSFNGKPYVNRGIAGQTTPQMLLRFRQDVIDLQPKAVVILGGINDALGNTGPMTIEQTEENLASMADLATANRIRVVLCSLLPTVLGPRPGQEPPGSKVLKINAWLKSYAREKGYVYVDFHSALRGEGVGMQPALTRDGLHPLPPGYAIMTPLVEAGIRKALGQ